MTKTVMVGGLPLGGGNPVLVQSMTNTDTRDAEATLKQICALHDAGCDIVRVSVYDEACAEAVKTLAAKSPVPLVADIHFDYRLAIRSAENGIAKLRINPGNIGGEAWVRELADCAKAHGIPIRIGGKGPAGQIRRTHGGMPGGERLGTCADAGKSRL